MKRLRPFSLWFAAAIVASHPVPAAAQTLTETQRQEIAAEIKRLTLEMNTLGTAAGFDSLQTYFAADGEGTWVGGPAMFSNSIRVLPTLQDVRSAFSAVQKARRSTNFTLISSRVAVLSADMALQVAEQHYSITDTLGVTGPTFPMASTTLWVKRPTGWKILHYHQSWSNTPVSPPKGE